MKRQMKLLQAVSKKLMKQFSGGLNEKSVHSYEGSIRIHIYYRKFNRD